MSFKIFLFLPLICLANEKLDLKFLQKNLTSKIITVDDQVYKKKKTYEGFFLPDVLNLLRLKGQEIEFHCQDGYKPILEMDQIVKGEPYLVFRDVENKDWEILEVGKSKITPGPFYLVWKYPTAESKWPYQIIGISQIDFSKKYANIFPPKLSKDSQSIERGFKIFKNHCLKCHSINLEGGELGPELNIPQNITEYRDKKYLQAFISDSNIYRARSTMPPFKEILTKKQIDEVWAYLSWMKNFKIN